MIPQYKSEGKLSSYRKSERKDTITASEGLLENEGDDSSQSCDQNLFRECLIQLQMGKSPYGALSEQYGSAFPFFDQLFLQTYLIFFAHSEEKDFNFFKAIIDGPIENSTRLCKLGVFNILFSNLPFYFDYITPLIQNSSAEGKKCFIETGGIYVLCYFSGVNDFSENIAYILYLLSNQDFGYFDEILPPNAFAPILCNFDTTLYFKLKTLFNNLYKKRNIQVLFYLIKSFNNIFKYSEKAAQKFGNIIIENFYEIIHNVFSSQNEEMISDFIENFIVLSEHFDIDAFIPDLVQSLCFLISSGNYQTKKNVIPKFLEIIDNTPLKLIPDILQNNVLQTLDDISNLENNDFLINIIESVSDLASKIIMVCDEFQNSYMDYVTECFHIIENLIVNEDQKVAELAETTMISLQNILMQNLEDE